MDKKLKKAAEKITMSDQLRDRILDQCNNASTKENDGSIEISGVERVEHKPISRIVAAAAACAVLAGGVGMTAHLLGRNGAPADEIEESSETETADTDSLFDFTGKEYSITDVEKDTELESSDQITAFLNCMDWGEQKDPDIYAGYYSGLQQTTHIEVRDRDKDYFYYINIAHTIATPPAEGETGIVMVTAKETDDKDWADGYYAIDLDTLTVFLGDEELRQDFGMKNLWPDFAGTNFSINGWGTSVDADKMELANIGEAIDALEFTPLGEVPEEYGQDSGEAWHLSSDQNELVLFPSGVAIYHKNVINQDSSLTNIYNTYYTYDYEAVSEILAPFTETNDQREAVAYLTTNAANKYEMVKQNEKFDDKFGNCTVTPHIVSIQKVPDSETSYQVRWTEEEYGIRSGDKKTRNMSGVFSYTMLPVEGEALQVNPLGLFITGFDFSNDASQVNSSNANTKKS